MRVIFCLSLFLSSCIFAKELVNQDLYSQLQEQKRGYSTKKFSIASDVELWKYWGDVVGFYHGSGYWIDIFAEYNLTDRVSLNLNQALVNGSISSGYLGNYRNVSIFSMNWEFSEKSAIRLFDLGPLTIGSGVLVEDALVSGARFHYQFSDYRFEAIISGTSVISVDGDLYTFSFEKESSKKRVGFLSYIYSRGLDFKSGEKYEVLPSLYFVSQKESRFIYGFEYAYNVSEQKNIYLLKLGHSFFDGGVEFYTQYRHYDSYGVSYFDNELYDYIPLSLMDRNYTNSQNLLGDSLERSITSLHLNFNFQINNRLSYLGTHEYVYTDYKFTDQKQLFINEKLYYSLKDYRNNSYLFTYITNKTLGSTNFRYAQDIYNEKYIIGLGIKLFL